MHLQIITALADARSSGRCDYREVLNVVSAIVAPCLSEFKEADDLRELWLGIVEDRVSTAELKAAAASRQAIANQEEPPIGALAEAFAAAALVSARNALVAARGPEELNWLSAFRLKCSLRRVLESANDAAELTPLGRASRVTDSLAAYVNATVVAA